MNTIAFFTTPSALALEMLAYSIFWFLHLKPCQTFFSNSDMFIIMGSHNYDMQSLHFCPSIFQVRFVLRPNFCFFLLCRMMSDYTVETTNDGLTEFNVEFHGPKQSMFYFLLA